MTIAAAKAELRRALRATLRDAGPVLATHRDALEAHAVSAIAALSLPPGTALGLYAPLGPEAGAAPLGAHLRRLGFLTAYPRVTASQDSPVGPGGTRSIGPVGPGGTGSIGAPCLAFHAVGDDAELAPGFRGIAEPDVGRPLLPAEQLALVLVPGLAFDRDGGRLGRGGGFYDRLLEDLPPTALRLGVAWACQISPTPLPREPHDAHVDAVVTESGLLTTPRWPAHASGASVEDVRRG